MLAWSSIGFLFFRIACGIRIVFRFCTIRDDEYLNEVEHRPACPERVTQITVDLVEGFLDRHPSAFQFDVYHRQAIHQDSDIIAVLMGTFFFLILVDDLQAVVIDVRLINQFDILRLPVIQCQVQDIPFPLQHLRLLLDTHLLITDHRQQTSPLTI